MSFVMSVRLSVRMEKLGSNWTEIHGIGYLGIFSKICLDNSNFTKIEQE